MYQLENAIKESAFMLALISAILIFSVSPVIAQSDALLMDNVTVEENVITHNMTAYADIKDVKVVDLYASNVSNQSTEFLGDYYSVVERNIGDMKRGEHLSVSYRVGVDKYALLGANKFRYQGENHRLAPQRVESRDSSAKSFLPAVLVLSLAVTAVIYYSSRSRPLLRRFRS
jgi:hypothetical protein